MFPSVALSLTTLNGTWIVFFQKGFPHTRLGNNAHFAVAVVVVAAAVAAAAAAAAAPLPVPNISLF